MNRPLSLRRYIFATIAWISFLVGTGDAWGAAPTVFSQAASNITATSAQLNAHVNPQGLSTTVYYQYGLTTTYSHSTAQRNIGTTSGTYPATVVSLTPGMTYHFRLVANSIGGTTYGLDRTFTTPVQPPSATTQPASSVTPTSAQLNSSVDPNGISTTIYFQYGLTTAYGSSTASGNIGLSAGNHAIIASGLAPMTTYHYRVVASSSAGTTYGANMTFTTPVPAPTATTQPASSVLSASAQLNGFVNPNGVGTTVYFQYGLTTAYGNNTASLNVGVSSGNQSAAISGLQPNKTYHYRIVATSSGGTTYGSDVTFTTPGVAPIAATLPASAISSSSAQLNGNVNPNGATATFYFQYGLTTASGNTTDAVNIGLAAGDYGTTASGLLPDTTYHYRVVVTNAAGTSFGSDMTFTTTVDPPSVTTRPASSITTTSAQLNSAVNPNGVSTSFYFQYGLTTAYTNSTSPASIGLTAGNYGTAISGLQPNTAYFYRVVATSAGGTSFGADSVFTTPAETPIVTTQPALSVTPTSAQFNGIIDPRGLATAAYFEYGTTTNYGTSVLATNAISAAQAIAINISGLAQNTSYHYRLVASNRQHVVRGLDSTFTTLITEQPAWVVNTGGASLRLRSFAGLSAPTVLFIPLGSEVTVLGNAKEADGHQWREVVYAAQSGWALAEYLVFTPGSPQPAPPIDLRQLHVNDNTVIADGGTSRVAAVILAATPSGSSTQQFAIQFELRPAGTNFVGPTAIVTSGQGGVQAQVTVGPLGNQSYHWRARTLDTNGVPSEWVSYSTNGTDFTIASNKPPVAAFNVSPAQVFAGDPVTFTAEDTAEANLTYHWEIGDTQATGPTKVQVFAQPGDVYVSLTVRDSDGNEGHQWQSVSVASRNLGDRIDALAAETQSLFDQVAATATLVGDSIAYFQQDVPSTRTDLEFKAALTVISLLLDSTSNRVDLVQRCTEWAHAAYGANAAARLSTRLGSHSSQAEVRSAFVEWAVAERSMDRATTVSRWLQGLNALIAEKKNLITDLRQQALTAAQALTTAQSNLLVTNLQLRLKGNVALKEGYAAVAGVPVSSHGVKSGIGALWNDYSIHQQILGFDAADGRQDQGLMTGLLAPSADRATTSELDVISVLAIQAPENQLLAASLAALGHASGVVNFLASNAVAGLGEVVSRAPTPVPQGRILSIDHHSAGSLRNHSFLPCWFVNEALSAITLENTGAISAVFRVEAFLHKKLIFGDLGNDYQIAVAVSDEVSLAPGAQGIIKLPYLSGDGGQNPDGEVIRYVLTARTANGCFGQDSLQKHFGTIYTDENEEDVPAAVIASASIIEAPLRSRLLIFPGSNTCQFTFFVRNPLKSAATLTVSQDLPEGASVIDAAGASQLDNRLLWELELGGGAVSLLQPILSLPSAFSGALPDATASLYDPVNTTWIPFSQPALATPIITAPRPEIVLSDTPSGFNIGLHAFLPGVYRVDATTNLIQWDRLVTVTNNAGTLQLSDPPSATHSMRFYRAQRD